MHEWTYVILMICRLAGSKRQGSLKIRHRFFVAFVLLAQWDAGNFAFLKLLMLTVDKFVANYVWVQYKAIKFICLELFHDSTKSNGFPVRNSLHIKMFLVRRYLIHFASDLKGIRSFIESTFAYFRILHLYCLPLLLPPSFTSARK